MQKRIFLQKGMSRANIRNGRGTGSHVKILLWAAVALIGLVVIAPLITGNGKKKEVFNVKSLDPDKGMLVKEIPVPRAIQLMQEDSKAPTRDQIPRNLLERSTPPGAPPHQNASEGKPAESKVHADVQQFELPSQVAVADPVASQKADGWIEIPKGDEGMVASSPASPDGQQKKEVSTKHTNVPRTGSDASGTGSGKPAGSKPSEKLQSTGDALASRPVPLNDPKKPDVATEAKKPAALTPVQQAKVSGNAKTQTTKAEVAKAEPPKPESSKVPAGVHGYSVQVGSFKDKANATEMKSNLEKRGYQVVVRTVNHPKHGELHVVQLKPVEDVAKASTLVEQIRSEEKVKPFVTPANDE